MLNFASYMMERFWGLEKAYGLYNLANSTTVEKQGTKILGQPSTILDIVDITLWEKHINGSIGLGIIPIMDDSNCLFGAIDVDIYSGINHGQIAIEIKKFDLPLVPCRSKSGGIHCFCFTKEPIPAIVMREKLQVFSAMLGFGNSEIFPKQSRVLNERGDIGQWINMPYFNAKNTDRYGINTDGSKMSCEEFIKAIDSVRMTRKEFTAFKIATIKEIEDGPPCLQQLLMQKFQSGSRNDGFLNLAIYLKMSDPDNWEVSLEDYNMRFVVPPLSSSEIQHIVKSLRKKDYNYMCQKAPIKNFCNSAICRTRKYGIGTVSPVQLTGLTKYNSQPPIWFVDVEGGGRMELSTEDIQSQGRFQRKCMEALNIMPPALNPNSWRELISQLLESVNIIQASMDASPKGMMFEYLERFCTSRVQGRNKEEILLSKPWTDEHFHWFRLSDFYAYLERNRFKDFKINQIASMIKERGGESQFIKLKGKGVNVWKFPTFEKQIEGFNIPIIEDREVM